MAKKKPAGFTSLRILGKKAQDLISKAAELKRRETETIDDSMLPDSPRESDVMVRFSLVSVTQAALVILALAVAVWVTVVLRDKIILLLLALFVAAVMDPGVKTLERMGFPRGIAILLLYFIVLFVLLFLLVSLIPIIASQLQQIAILVRDMLDRFFANPQVSLPLLTYEVNARLTEIVAATLENMSINKFTDALNILEQNMSSFAQGSVIALTRIAGSVSNFFVKLVVVLVLAFFIQIEKEHMRLWVRSFFTARYRAYIDTKGEIIHMKIGQWARGQILLGLAIGTLVFIALTILRIPYAATLAVLAGFTEFIPYIGPFIAAIPAILVALTEGGMLWALIVAGVYYIVQWCENNLLVPLIMKRAVGLSPIAVIFAMLMGLSFPAVIHPILGLLVAVPVTTIIAVFLDDWRVVKKP
jgi:predicted PurR-regulated permease PerM